jgi:putative ABC transport system permease protein
MSLWRQLTRGFNTLLHRQAADKAVADEVEHYVEQATAAFMASGLSPEDARRAARIELGSPSVAREQVRSYGWEHTVRTMLADLHYAGRQLVRNPGFAVSTSERVRLGFALRWARPAVIFFY